MLRICSFLVVFLLHVKGFYGSEVSVYVALQGDLNLTVRADRWWNGTSHKIAARIMDAANETVTQKSFVVDRQVLNVTFSCGVVNRAGRYRVQFSVGAAVVDEVPLQVVWPPIILQAPSEMSTYRSAFQVKIQWVHLKCYPPKTANISVSADVIHCGLRNTSCSFQWLQQVRASVAVTDVWQTHGIVDASFGCQSLSRSGFYRIALRVSSGNVINADDIIGVSDRIHVMTNADFQLQIRSQYAVPCRQQVLVFYRHPSCTGTHDRIRLYAKIYSNVSVSIARPFRMDYIGEQQVAGDRNVVAFACRSLEERLFDALCFRYVNIADDKSVTEISESCIPRHATSGYVEPNWGLWSRFSACTSKCGDGIRYRYRYCDNPSPQYVGSFCSGHPIEVDRCRQATCPEVATTRSPLLESEERRGTSGTSADLTAICRCGCSQQLELNNISLTLAASSAMCYHHELTWMFNVSSHNRIRVNFDYLRLGCHADIALVIRDGATTYSPLIQIIDGQAEARSLSMVTTTTSTIFMELNAGHVVGDDEFPQCITGFVASLRVVESSDTATDHPVVSNKSKISDMQSTIIAIASILLIVAGGVSILSALYSKCGLQLRHGLSTNLTKESISDCSDWSDESEYQLLSVTTVTSVVDDDSSNEMNKLDVSPPAKTRHIRAMKSLPNSPLTGMRKGPRVNLSVLSRSSATILQLRHPDRLNSVKIDQSQCSIYSLNDSGRREDIELCEILKTDSEVTLKLNTNEEEKVLNTKFKLRVSSSQETCTSFTKSSVSFATASISDQEFELDYYDLDVCNPGDVADSFLRCIDEDVIFWDHSLQDSTSSVMIGEGDSAVEVE